MKFLRRFMSDKKVEQKYVGVGAQFGSAVSYIYMGECVGFESMLNRWADWEKEYVNRGYKTLSLDDFVELGGYGKSIESLLSQKLGECEKPIFHAQIYRDNYLGKVSPAINLGKVMDGEAQFGGYILPSTKSSSEQA